MKYEHCLQEPKPDKNCLNVADVLLLTDLAKVRSAFYELMCILKVVSYTIFFPVLYNKCSFEKISYIFLTSPIFANFVFYEKLRLMRDSTVW